MVIRFDFWAVEVRNEGSEPLGQGRGKGVVGSGCFDSAAFCMANYDNCACCEILGGTIEGRRDVLCRTPRTPIENSKTLRNDSS